MNTNKIKTIIRAFHFDAQIQPIRLNLPIVFQKRYDYSMLVVQGKSFLLLKERRTGSLDSFVKHAQVIRNQVGEEVILVFNKLSDDQKKKLLQVGAAYLDYQENAFIPQLGFLFSKEPNIIQTSSFLSPIEQKLLITLLLHTKTFVIDMDKICQLTGLSRPSLYRYFRGFKERQWLVNKQKSYHLAKSKRMIFEEAKELLDNPIKEVVTISDQDFQQLKNKVALTITNLQALSILGMLADTEDYGSYAISKKQYRGIKKELQQHILQGHRLEIWYYEPIPFDYQKNGWSESVNMTIVDPLSLYLILKTNEDPRIEEDIERLEEKILTLLGE
ncbi:hypothetical protein [Streptococcus cuniculipharyngis]|uniref:Uncharacterized protein n=1 Tax=Streptococcus cuniculipharyngis TaxID=1562651 RepID=A0A5C5SFE7_9STRE|nr:hypothetical protein [Streptococcus cuniculipharyngis]TWS98848.1 hypothetical protein FRX57_01145 [Streptococcus cuniculipharyngis]